MSDPDIYTVGWICAIRTEFTAARQFLDEEHELPSRASCNDNNAYTVGRIGKHNVVIALLPIGGYGVVPAAAVARDMLHSFPNIRIGLMVGIGGGAPSDKHDIRLGDVVVSCPGGGRGGIWQYDFGKDRSKMRKKFGRPSTDQRFVATFLHSDPEKTCNEICVGPNDEAIDIDYSDRLYPRKSRTEDREDIEVFYGLIASGNTLMKNAERRDSYAKEGVLCFEMEAAGLLNHFPCLVIRGICDYSDTHKNKEWQGYAAMTAAAFATNLLNHITPRDVDAQKSLRDHMSSLGEKLDNVASIAQNTHAFMRDVKTERSEDKLLSWLAAPDPSKNYRESLRKRHPGSGQWFLQSSEYSDWKTRPNSFLWLHGIPGCGKTILSSTIIEDLEKDRCCRPLYYYFDFAESKQQSLEGVIRHFIYHLYKEGKDAQKHLETLYLAHRRTESPSIESLNATFRSILQQTEEIWIVLDALDEFETRQGYSEVRLLPWMDQLLKSTKTKVHLLVTSRPEKDIQSFYKSHARSQDIIHIQSDLVSNDISTYVKDRVRNHDGLKKWSCRPKIQDDIEAALLQQADGMFRWVACQLDALEECSDPVSLRRALRSLPRTLNDTYARILEKIPDAMKPSSIRILQFLTYCSTPLRIDEAVDAIAVDIERKPFFEIENRMLSPEDNITAYCSGLVTVVKSSKYRNKYGVHDTATRIQLAHFSVKEYLMSAQLDKDVAEGLDETNARVTIAQVCLSYWLGISDDTERLETRLANKEFPLADFATANWAEHARVVHDFSSSVRSLAEDFFTTTACFKLSYKHLGREPFDAPDLELALLYASNEGITSSVEALLRKGACANAEHRVFNRSALVYACFKGHLAVVRLLLQNGADIDSISYTGLTPLRVACIWNHVEIVELLLQLGALVNDRRELHASRTITLASSQGHLDIVNLLLAYGAEINPDGMEKGSALSAASLRGHLEIVENLLNSGADVNARDRAGGTALSKASLGGQLEVVKMLLACGADVDPCGRKFLKDSPQTHFEAVSLAQTSFPWPNAAKLDQDLDYFIPLHNASRMGHLEIVEALLLNGANVDAPCSEFPSPLYAASKKGNVEIVLTLLANGANVNPFSDKFPSPLHTASERGHTKVVEILLGHGASTEANSNNQTPLMLALRSGQAKTAQLLLENHAQIGEIPEFVVAEAALHKRVQIVQMLLDLGAKVNTPFQGTTLPVDAGSWEPLKACGTALQFAAYHGDIELIQALLDKGADVHAEHAFQIGVSGSKVPRDPYHVAVRHGHTEAACVLLRYLISSRGVCYIPPFLP
ncbi:ankyrin repeat-containing domain protein [Phyllosticta capitalensis]|uniref:ankyrin repeat-containing domain protein n=1 Tax=Phyllosticta capitalensis TaxID=121624 RepID=UPI0031300333